MNKRLWLFSLLVTTTRSENRLIDIWDELTGTWWSVEIDETTDVAGNYWAQIQNDCTVRLRVTLQDDRGRQYQEFFPLIRKCPGIGERIRVFGLTNGRNGESKADLPCYRKYVFQPAQTTGYKIIKVEPGDNSYDVCVCQKIQFITNGSHSTRVPSEYTGTSIKAVTQFPFSFRAEEFVTMYNVYIDSEACDPGPCCDSDPNVWSREDFWPYAKPSTINKQLVESYAEQPQELIPTFVKGMPEGDGDSFSGAQDNSSEGDFDPWHPPPELKAKLIAEFQARKKGNDSSVETTTFNSRTNAKNLVISVDYSSAPYSENGLASVQSEGTVTTSKDVNEENQAQTRSSHAPVASECSVRVQFFPGIILKSLFNWK